MQVERKTTLSHMHDKNIITMTFESSKVPPFSITEKQSVLLENGQLLQTNVSIAKLRHACHWKEFPTFCKT